MDANELTAPAAGAAAPEGVAQAIGETRAAVEAEVGKVVVGQDEAVRLLLIGLLAGGHVLLEGPPGVAKTLLGRAFAAAVNLQFGRIQFTPDLMPGDVLGSNVFNFQSSAFELVLGPIFTELLLADEINRTPPKTQAALLEAMNERTVTIDGETRKLSDAFMVVATQNPIEQQGAYPLPEAQLDRFLFKHVLGYPDRDEELRIVEENSAPRSSESAGLSALQPVVTVERLLEMRAALAGLRLTSEIASYVVDLARATRQSPLLEYGVSPRAAAMLARASRVAAALDGRAFVIPDDVKSLAPAVFRHRVIITPGAEIEGETADGVIAEILNSVEPPR